MHSFALWCLMKSPLIIGTDVLKLPAASLAILQNERLITVNQDDLMMQGTLRATFDASGKRCVSRQPRVFLAQTISVCRASDNMSQHFFIGSSWSL